MDRRAVENMWESFRQACGVDADDHDAFAFGDSPAMADELADLVLHGPKRATAGLLLEFERDHEPVPREGGYWVVADGRGLPVCVIRTTQVEIKPLREVDAGFAWDEGEGERTLAWWLDAHRRYFTRRCAELGIRFSDELPTVFERFELVWPRPEEVGSRS
ncbi:MAG TPA: ASCH domain-containing protein [Actinomycetes bacterium]|nr:ASCH domain-containing protein [Actinomycetes bacterium]